MNNTDYQKIEEAFHAYLDRVWPDWRTRRGEKMYEILREAFFAGASVRRLS